MSEGRKLAVALEYEKPRAPRVTAIGYGDFARKIVELAEANRIPITKNPGLATALSQVELEQEIPVELYRAVAEVLTYILRMSGRLKSAG
ncbi:MAG TPA: EscU/YscU/HrcU family type III secretion system export apparatus switch protein [Pseudolabrys sp.]|nr:EscU/YscU/HrcU family type III secretion system export apparatus switch protein [Pseudolabrys sp.]